MIYSHWKMQTLGYVYLYSRFVRSLPITSFFFAVYLPGYNPPTLP
jgi:hypothetical protein